MNNKKSRIHGIVFLLLIPLSLFSACRTVESVPTQIPVFTATSAVSSDTPVPTPTLLPTNTPFPPHLDLSTEEITGMEIQIWHGQRDKVKKELEYLVAKFNDENEYGLKVFLTAELSDIDLNQRVVENAFSGSLPNLIISDSFWLRQWQSEKIPLVNLEDYMIHPVWGFDAMGITPIMDPMLSQERFNGLLIGLPLWHNPFWLFYNKTWAQELGFSNPPVTMDDFSQQSCAARDALNNDSDPQNNGTGGWILSTNENTLMSWLLNRRAVNSTLENFPQNTDSESFIAVSQWLRDLFNQGCLWQSRLSEPYNYFSDHMALFYSGSFSDIQLQRMAFQNHAMNRDDEWELIPYPRATDHGKIRNPQIYSTGTSIGIFTATAREQFASWQFLSWLMKDENITELALVADGWPVQESAAADQYYQDNANSKIYQSLGLRKYISPVQLPADWNIHSLVLADGFGNVFNASTLYEKIPEIWTQIEDTLAEIKNQK